MEGPSSPAALEVPSSTPLGGPSGLPSPLAQWHRACPLGFRLAPALTEPLLVDLPPSVIVEVSVQELQEAAELDRIAGVIVMPESDVIVLAGSSHIKVKHDKTRAVLLVGTRDLLGIETIYAKLASMVRLWPIELDRGGTN